MKNLVAMIAGIVIVGVGIWRLTQGELAGGLVLTVVGGFLLLRGLTGTVRPGL